MQFFLVADVFFWLAAAWVTNLPGGAPFNQLY